MDYIRLDPRRHTKPKALRVGWLAMRVYEHLVDICALYDLRGLVPADYADPLFIAQTVAMRPEDVGQKTAADLVRVLDGALDRLGDASLIRVEAGGLVICGWEEFYGQKRGPAAKVDKFKVSRDGEVFSPAQKKSSSTPHHSTPPHNTEEVAFSGKQLAQMWNAWAAAQKLPQVTKVAGKRASLADARAKEHPPEYWQGVLARIAQSPGLLGKNDRNWAVTFDWLLRPMSAAMVMEGKYDKWGKGSGSSAPVLSESDAAGLYGEG